MYFSIPQAVPANMKANVTSLTNEILITLRVMHDPISFLNAIIFRRVPFATGCFIRNIVLALDEHLKLNRSII